MSAGPRRRATTEMTNLAVLMQPLHEDAGHSAEDNLDSLVNDDVFHDAEDIGDSEKAEEIADAEAASDSKERYWNADGTARVLPINSDATASDHVVVDLLRAVPLVERPCDRDAYVDA
jgi:hypothetical protein